MRGRLAEFGIGLVLLTGCSPEMIWDAKQANDEAKTCAKRATEPQFPQDALVAEFDKINRKIELDKDPNFDSRVAASNFRLMSDSDARAMLWALCAGTSGGNCDDPLPRADGTLTPPRTCRFRDGSAMVTADNPFLT